MLAGYADENVIAPLVEPFAPIIYWPQQRRRIAELVRAIIGVASNHDYPELIGQVFFL